MSLFEAIARVSAERMFNCLIGGFAVALLTWVLLRALGRQNSGTRFAAWFAALIAIAVLPLFGSSPVSAVSGHAPITVPGSWAVYVFAAWALVASVGLLRVVYGVWQVHRLRQSCTDLESVDPQLKSSIEEVWTGKRLPRISVSDAARVPVAIGFFRPMIVLPAWVVEDLSPAELNTILLHEAAHLRRRDHWTNLAQKVLHALFFFHPAVWWIENRISLEREMACDDAVLERVSSPRAYAECLVAVAEKSFLRRSLTLVQAAVSRARQTTLRIASILDARRPGATRIWKPALVLVTGVSVACVSAIEHAPRLIGFSDASAAPRPIAVGGSVDRISRVGAATLIPAALHWNANSASPALSKPSGRKQIRKTKQQPVPLMRTLIRTKATVTRPPRPMLVLASARQPSAQPAIAPSPEAVFVVMRSLQFDGRGSMVWSLTVWRVAVTPENKRVGVTPRSI
jgi:beta-lactamase regulating signal transducer with metallopeptidase domain